jgi:type II secretory pathway component PulF
VSTSRSNHSISQEASNGILRSFSSLIKVGNSLPSALEVLIEVETGKNKKILEKVHNYVTKQDFSIGNALLKEGIIKHSEVFVVDRSTDALAAIDSILVIRQLSGNFEKSMIKIFAFPLVAVLIGLIIAYAAQPTFFNMVNSMVQQVKVIKGINIEEGAQLIWYLQSRTITLTIMQVYLTSLVSLISLYAYYLKYKPSIIYKIFPLKAYDDVPYILMLIYNLQKVGLDQVRVYALLKESSPRVGWIRLFESLEKEARAGRYIYTVFQRFNFPKDVVLVLKSSEVSKTFWDGMGALVTYVQETNESKHKLLNTLVGGFSTIAGFLIILYFVAGLFLAMFELQNLATSLM